MVELPFFLLDTRDEATGQHQFFRRLLGLVALIPLCLPERHSQALRQDERMINSLTTFFSWYPISFRLIHDSPELARERSILLSCLRPRISPEDPSLQTADAA